MSAVSAPFGFRPAYNPIGLDRAKKYTIATGYTTPLYEGMPVVLDTNGTLTVGATGVDLIGVFAGCEYIDANGKPNVSTYWPGTAGATNIVAWVYDDPNNVYEVQASGAVPQTAIGDQSDVINPTNNSNGRSTSGLDASLKGAAASGQFRIVGFGQQLDNAPGDAYTICQVQIARHVYITSKNAI